VTREKPRHRSSSGYARGEETRQRIIDAALELFGERGYQRASTRDIAARAGVNPPALQYYFDNKHGLYLACIDYIASDARERIAPMLDACEKALEEGREPLALIDVYCDMQEALADFLISAPNARSRSLFMARERLDTEIKSASFSIQSRFSCRFYQICGALVGRVIGQPADAAETLLVAMTLNGQIMSFHLSRDFAMDTLGWKEITPARLGAIKATARAHTRAVLLARLAEHRAADAIPDLVMT